LTVHGQRGAPPDHLKSAREAFERHNYRVALEHADAFLKQPDQTPRRRDAAVIRARSLIGLRQWDDGVAELEALIEAHEDLGGRVDLHQVLAKVADRAPQYGYLAINHYETIAELQRLAGNVDAAARALIARGRAFVRFPPQQWTRPGSQDVQPPPAPADWRASRKFQRDKAAACYDRAISLEPTDAIIIEALQAKALLFARQIYIDPGDVDRGIKLYRQIVERQPRGDVAAQAHFDIGSLLERRRQDYAGAVDAYKRAAKAAGRKSPLANRAANQIVRIQSPILVVRPESPVPSKEHAEIHWQVRNIEVVDFKVYRVGLDALIDLSKDPRSLSQWQPGRAIPVVAWTLQIPATRKHVVHRSDGDADKPSRFPVTDAGAYVGVAQASGLYGGQARRVFQIIVSDLVGIAKTGRQQSVLWVVNGRTGEPVSGVDVWVGVGRKKTTAAPTKTDDAGVFLYRQARKPEPGEDGRLTYWIEHGEHIAVCDTWFGGGWSGDTFRVYTFTDRPVYRPDQTVHFKHTVRLNAEGGYETPSHKKVITRVRTPQGEVAYEVAKASNADGSVSGSWRIPTEPALGLYRMEVEIDGETFAWGNAGAQFRVEEYRKPEFEVTVTPHKSSYRLGDLVNAEIVARYYFGDPVADAKISYEIHRGVHYPRDRPTWPCPWLFDGSGPLPATRDLSDRFAPWHHRPLRRDLVATGHAVTDAGGKAVISFEAKPFEQTPDVDVRYTIDAEVTDSSRRVIEGRGSIIVARRPFWITLMPQRNMYQPGDTVHVDVVARDANGGPVSFDGTAEVYRLHRTIKDERSEYTPGDQVASDKISVGVPGDGVFRYVADEAGPFRIIVRANAPNEPDDLKPVGRCDVWIARQGGRYDRFAYRDVELVLDKPYYEQGDTARILINTRHDSAYVLLTVEADDLLGHQIVVVRDASTIVEMPITRRHVPNFRLSAALVARHTIFQDDRDVTVPPTHQLLNVTIDTEGREFKPSSHTTATVTVRDHEARPAKAEVAVMVLDSSVCYIQPEFRQAVDKYFYGERRRHGVNTGTNILDVKVPGVSARFAIEEASQHEKLAAGAEAPLEAMYDKDEDSLMADAERFAKPALRKEFADTVVWTAHAHTGSDGRVEVDVPFPDNLTTWRLHAVAVDRDTRAGQASKDMITAKEIIARLQTPRFLVQGDRAELLVIAHNDTDEDVTARVSLESDDYINLGRAAVDGQVLDKNEDLSVEITVPAKGETRVTFDAVAIDTGLCSLTATVAGTKDGDAVQIHLPVLPYGADRLLADGGVIREGDEAAVRTVAMTLPDDMAPASPLLEIHVTPSIAAVMIDALPYLFEYPYGCTEQTMSRFLPAVVARRTMQALGIDLDKVKAKIDAGGCSAFDTVARPGRFTHAGRVKNPVFDEKVVHDMIKAGVARLTSMQHNDGGWGWWKGDGSNAYMTAYVVYGFAEAKAADISFDPAILERGVEFLKRRLAGTEPAGRYRWTADDDNVRMWMLYALSTADPNHLSDPKTAGVLDRIYDDRDGLTDYGRAMLAIALHRLGDLERMKIVIENFENTVRVDKDAQTVSWAQATGYRRWYDNGLETTAMVLRAMLAGDPEHPWAPKAMKWIVRNRRGTRWQSTKDTAFAVYAMSEYLTAFNELDPDMTVSVSLDDHPLRSFHITKDNALSLDTAVIVGSDRLGPGLHHVTVDKKGRGNVYFNTYLEYYTHEDPIPPAGNEMYVSRTYHRLTPKEVERTRKVYDPDRQEDVEETYRAIEFDRREISEVATIETGDLIEVELTVDARNNFEYVMFIDPKPAGCEPVELRSGATYGGGFYGHIELGDEDVTFFATYLPQGERTVSYRLRCETPGSFSALPTQVQAMYAPFVRGNSDSARLKIRGKKGSG